MARFLSFSALAVFITALLAFQSHSVFARSDLIEAGASQNHFYIEPSYDGTSIALFGSIDNAQRVGAPFEVAVTLHGPVRPVTVWKKARRFGLWLNAESFTFERVPNFYAVLSTKPLAEIAVPDQRREYEIGFDTLESLRVAVPHGDDIADAPQEFRDALIKLKLKSGLFIENERNGVEFLGARLFRSRVYLPAAAGPGLYRVNYYVLQKGVVVGEASAHIRLNKIGIEAWLSSAAADYPWSYGVLSVLLAAGVGGVASLIFRRA